MNGYHLYRKAWRFDGAPHEESQLPKKEWRALLKHGGLMVRNTYDFDCRPETSFWHLIKDRFGGMEELSRKNRKAVRKALNTLDYKIVDKQLIEKQGYVIAKKVYEGYKTGKTKMDLQAFQKLLDVWTEENHEFWGIFDLTDGKLVGFSVVRLFDGCCLYDTACILPEYKYNKSGVFYGMYYKHNEYYLGEKRLKYVTDGTRSITEHSNVQPFLEEKFHFRKAYCRLAVHYKWWVGLIVKALYPFRRIITVPSVKAVLNMEEMQSGKA